jgi:saxitoxin biosynthesis operon SxtJ-like protein
MAADRNRPSAPSERSFGLLFAAGFALLAWWLARHGHPGLALASAAAVAVLLLLAFVAPQALAVPNRAWFRFGLLLHKVVSPIVLGAIFFLVITPLAFAMRRAGRDPLERQREPGRASYWKDRDPPGPKPDSFRNQF